MSKQVTAWVAPYHAYGLTYGDLFIQEEKPKMKGILDIWKGDGYVCQVNNWTMCKLGLNKITEPTKITITIETE